MILSLDFGETTGYALSTFPKFSSGIAKFKESKKQPNKYASFKNFLSELIVARSPNRIVYEDVKRHSNTAAAHVWGGYRAVLEVTALENNIILYPLPVKTIKKIFTGDGNAGKEKVLEKCYELGYNISDHNEADAVAILSVFFKIQNSFKGIE